MADTALYQGLYINLDRSPERRERIEQQLRSFGLENQYRRFPGVDGSALNVTGGPLRPGEVGAFLSHMRAIESVRGLGKCVHIVEDDALLSEHVRPVVDDAIEAKVFGHYDLLFTDMLVNCHLGLLKSLLGQMEQFDLRPRETLRLKDLRMIDFAQVNSVAFQSYVVSPDGIDKMLALYRQEIAAGPRLPVDIFIRDQVIAGKLRAACVFPFVTSFRLEDVNDSTIMGNEGERPSVMALAVLRYLFFANRDMAYARKHLDAATAEQRNRATELHKAVTQAMSFVLSGDFQEF